MLNQFRDQEKGGKIAQVTWGEVFQSLEIHVEEFGLFSEDLGRPWEVFEHCCNRMKTKPQLILARVKGKSV